jgi:transposase InsO family protein
MHNETIVMNSEGKNSFFRVVLTDKYFNTAILANIDSEKQPDPKLGGRKRNEKSTTKKIGPPPNVGELIWLKLTDLADTATQGLVRKIHIDNERPYLGKLSASNELVFQNRLTAMASFLDLDQLRENLFSYHSIAKLVEAAAKNSKCSKPAIYRWWSLLCREGFTENSLRPKLDRCGAPGKLRPCEPEGRRKPGRKTYKEKLAPDYSAPIQPGMNTNWRHLIMAADRKIPTPKPKFPDRYQLIIESNFLKRFTQIDGKLIPSALVQGEYPNRSQVRRVLENELPRLQRAIEKTTKAHFQRAFRGMTGRNWKGVAGPGHTWAIDSTIGDIYLRSSINRAWIIGRPVVYVIVDVWSTAIVGFYVCLMGPSWDMAKLALFSAAADPTLIGELWDYQPIVSLSPLPTLPVVLMCDRGEYLSKSAKATGMKLIDCLSYAPPYRADLKGLVEVLHRIEKDKQYNWVPGSIDARRKEYELRKFDPTTSVLTLKEYTNYLHGIFSGYNLTADRTNRLDTHMIAAGTHPSPAGLWHWGHDVGIGTRKSIHQEQLITDLLPKATARITRQGLRFSRLTYESEIINQEQWTAISRNFGSWEIDAFYYSGSVSRIWTPNLENTGLIEHTLSQQTLASREQTFDEIADAFMYGKTNTAELAHWNLMRNLEIRKNSNDLIKQAKIATTEAIAKNTGAIPNITESRSFETLGHNIETASENVTSMEVNNSDAETNYLRMMKEVMNMENE